MSNDVNEIDCLAGKSLQSSITFESEHFELKVETNPKTRVLEATRLYESRISKWLNSPFNAMYTLGAVEIVFLIITGKFFWDDIYWLTVSAITILIAASSIYMLVCPSFASLRMNHGAEHKTILAYRKNDLANAQKYPIFTDACGCNITPVMVVLILLSPIIKFPIIIFLCYLNLYIRFRSFRYPFYNTVGKLTQYLFVSEPTPDILEAAQKGLEKIIEAEARGVGR